MRRILKYKLDVRSFCSFLLVVLALVSGCDRRPLEVMEPMKAEVRLDFDWMSRYGFTPESMTVMIWRENTLHPQVTHTNNVHSMMLDLDPGTYRVIAYSYSPDEYGSMDFRDTDDYNTISARGKDVTLYENGDWDKDVRYMTDPEDIGVVAETFTITDAMLLEQVTFHPYESWIRQRFANTRFYQEADGVYSLPLVIKPVITKLNVYVEVGGLENLAELTGSITGMADGFYLTHSYRTEDVRTMLLPTNKWTKAKDIKEHGTVYLYHQTPVFGLPHGKEHLSARGDDFNVFTIHATMRDGTTKLYTYNVGKLIKYRGLEEGMEFIHDMHLELEMDLVLDISTVGEENIPIFPDVIPSGDTGSGFGAEVEAWQEGESTDLRF
ncbi:MAG: DUF5119 domain-containing protein [Bacteroidaceae bacterium]|nr:DUF5119 domain-containing protein [Bacteroidaceae bacterium]